MSYVRFDTNLKFVTITMSQGVDNGVARCFSNSRIIGYDVSITDYIKSGDHLPIWARYIVMSPRDFAQLWNMFEPIGSA